MRHRRKQERVTVSTGLLSAYLFVGGTLAAIYLARETARRKR